MKKKTIKSKKPARTGVKKVSAHKAAARSDAPLSPLGDKVVVKPLSADERGTMTASGIIIPDSANEKPEQGTVIAVGPGKFENGARIPMGVSVGDSVMFSKYGFDEIKIKGVTYYVLSESSILAVIN